MSAPVPPTAVERLPSSSILPGANRDSVAESRATGPLPSAPESHP